MGPMNERTAASEAFELPEGLGQVNLKKDDDTVAVCITEGCGSIIFIGNSRDPIQRMVLRDRILDHKYFAADEEGNGIHELILSTRVRGNTEES